MPIPPTVIIINVNSKVFPVSLQYRSKVSWHSKLETRDLILASRSSNASSFKMRGSSLEFR